MQSDRRLLAGNEAVALAARDFGVTLGVGYPGTPSTEILETLSEYGGRAQWSPNEKVALEVGIGVAFGGGRALVTMKHVGVNVAADPLFTLAYTGVDGALVIVTADDPGMASSQNEQDNRRYAVAAGVPMLEPSDSQEAYDFLGKALDMSHRWHTPVFLRLTTRICHSKTVVVPTGKGQAGEVTTGFERDTARRVMIPAYARPAHKRLRERLSAIQSWSESCDLNVEIEGDSTATTRASDLGLGIITSGISYQHVREAAPAASILKLGLSYPLAYDRIRAFVQKFDRCVVVEEGDPYLVESLRAEGIEVEGKAQMYRFGELNVRKVQAILAGEEYEQPSVKGKPPALCNGCPHRTVFGVLNELGCIVSGDIGCYTLATLPPFEAIDTCVCMGASISVGLGLRHVLPDEQARKVVSVIGDSTFVHSGLTGIAEMVYNPPKTGHVVIILDNGTTAMTGLQEHPGTGRLLDHTPTNKVVLEDACRGLGVKNVHVLDMTKQADDLPELIRNSLAGDELTVIITRRPCLLAAGKIRQYEQAASAE